MKKQIDIFFTALMFFTRIPCPKWIGHDPDYLRQSSKYFPLIGILVGGIGALVFYSTSYVFPKEIAILLSMIATVYTTGAFHEDGFADVCDGFGGGWTKKKILLIMKDSTLGTYGVIGITAVLALKFLALYYVPSALIPLVLISGHAISRSIATTLIYTHPYVRDTEDSKAKPAAKSISIIMLSISILFGLVPLLFFKTFWILLVLVPPYLSKVFLGYKFMKWIGGQTGDCAGAVQQLAELIFYLSLIALWKFI